MIKSEYCVAVTDLKIYLINVHYLKKIILSDANRP